MNYLLDTKNNTSQSPYLISCTAQSTARAVNAIYVSDGFCVEGTLCKHEPSYILKSLSKVMMEIKFG